MTAAVYGFPLTPLRLTAEFSAIEPVNCQKFVGLEIEEVIRICRSLLQGDVGYHGYWDLVEGHSINLVQQIFRKNNLTIAEGLDRALEFAGSAYAERAILTRKVDSAYEGLGQKLVEADIELMGLPAGGVVHERIPNLFFLAVRAHDPFANEIMSGPALPSCGRHCSRVRLGLRSDFSDVRVSLDHAERLVRSLSAGGDEVRPHYRSERQSGRPRDTGFVAQDEPLIAEGLELIKRGEANSAANAASLVAGRLRREGKELPGQGTSEESSRLKRLQRGISKKLRPNGK